MKSRCIRETRNCFYRLFLVLLLVLMVNAANVLIAQDKTVTYYADPSSVPPDLPVKITHLTAHVSFKPEQNLVIGSAEFTLIPNRCQNDSIVFQTPDFNVSSVRISGKEMKYRQSGSTLIIEPVPCIPSQASGLTPESVRLLITYTATPLAGPVYFIGWRPEEAGKRKEVWAHRPNGWLPYMDGRITVDIDRKSTRLNSSH